MTVLNIVWLEQSRLEKTMRVWNALALGVPMRDIHLDIVVRKQSKQRCCCKGWCRCGLSGCGAEAVC